MDTKLHTLRCSGCNETFGFLIGIGLGSAKVFCDLCEKAAQRHLKLEQQRLGEYVDPGVATRPALGDADGEVMTRPAVRGKYTPRQVVAGDGRRAVEALATGTQSALMQFPLPTGKKLGDCTRNDVIFAQTTYEANSRSEKVRAKWMQLIAQSLIPGKTVKEAITEERLNELRDEARREKV